MKGKGTHYDRRVQYLVTLSVSLASLNMGALSAWPTPSIHNLKSNGTNIDINDDEIAWMLSTMPLGFITGSLASRFVSDQLGRRAAVLGSACPIALGTIVVAFALKPWLLYITRFLWGNGVGILSTRPPSSALPDESVKRLNEAKPSISTSPAIAIAAEVTPMYIAEIADKEVRATLSLCTRVTFNLGNLLVMSIGMFVSYQCLNYMILVLPVLYLLACFWIPESPYYYLKEGKVAAAKKVLMKIRNCKDEKELEEHLTRMQEDVRTEMRRSSSAKELITGRHYRKAVIIATGLKMTQMMTGVLTVQQYLARIIEESKTALPLPTVIVVFGAVRFVVGIMGSILVDRVGRRPLLFYSLLGTGLSLTVVFIYFFLQEVIQVDPLTLSPYGFIPFAGIISSNVISTIGYNSIMNVVAAEIFPLNVKAVAMTSLSIVGGVFGFIISKGFQEVKNWSGLSGVFCVFAGFAFGGAVFVLCFVPETKGKSLKDIQILLQGDIYNETEGEKLEEEKTENPEEASERNELLEISLKKNDLKV